MAVVLKSNRKNPVETNFKGYRNKLIIKYIIRAISLAVFVTVPWYMKYLMGSYDVKYAAGWGIALIASIFAFAFTFPKINKWGMRALKSGWTGEKRTAKLLKNLPNGYYVLPDVYLAGDIQADCVVVGPTGIFVIETKNHKGNIRIKSKKAQVYIDRVDKHGEVHTGKMDNPIIQTERIVSGIKKYAGRSFRYPVSVSGMVYFSGTKTTVINNSDYPVFFYKKRSELLKYIINAPVCIDMKLSKRTAQIMRQGEITRS